MVETIQAVLDGTRLIRAKLLFGRNRRIDVVIFVSWGWRHDNFTEKRQCRSRLCGVLNSATGGAVGHQVPNLVKLEVDTEAFEIR